MAHKFEVGQKVIFINDNGVNWGEKTITKLDTRSGRPTYFIEPTDTPWYSVPETNLTATKSVIKIQEVIQ